MQIYISDSTRSHFLVTCPDSYDCWLVTCQAADSYDCWRFFSHTASKMLNQLQDSVMSPTAALVLLSVITFSFVYVLITLHNEFQSRLDKLENVMARLSDAVQLLKSTGITRMDPPQIEATCEDTGVCGEVQPPSFFSASPSSAQSVFQQPQGCRSPKAENDAILRPAS